ncbi:condensation domain-containing protein [uncultured Azohydromonas sp.]|uniref:condensation domain-containing protein n=1 Tax=uncultured Azohydromonas sp. TaxID=487342 RepID=UPI002614666A|nr:condensation domain-containing protein [uncultured Azohydromonas sp.]
MTKTPVVDTVPSRGDAVLAGRVASRPPAARGGQASGWGLESGPALADGVSPLQAHPLTALQQTMLHHALVAGGSAYHQQLLARFDGVLDTARLRRAWGHVVARHDALRGHFAWDRVSQPLHLVPDREPPKLDVVVIGSETMPDEVLAPVIESELSRDLGRPFQPHRERPMRLRLLRAGPQRHWLLWSFHHLMLDGRSVAVVLEEVLQAYRRDAAPMAPVPALADWHGWRLARDPMAARRHWQAALAGLDAGATLGVGTGQGTDAMPEATERVALEGPLLEAATALAESTHATLHHLLLAAWGVAVAWSRGRRDVIFGTELDGRDAPLPGIKRLVGMLMTTVPVRVCWQPGEGLRTLLARVRNEALEAQAVPPGALSDAVSVEGLCASDLVDHLLLLPQWPGSELAQPVDETVMLSAVDFRASRPFGLGVWLQPTAQGWELLLRSRSASCGPARLAVLAWLLRTVLVEGLAQPDLSLELLTPAVPNAAAPELAPRRAVPAPAPAVRPVVDADVLARMEAVWAQVLGRPVRAQDNFFHCGGDSPLAMRLVGAVNQEFAASLRLSDLYAARTPAALAARVEGGEEHLARSPRADGDVPLSAAQRALWRRERLQLGQTAESVVDAFRVEGALDMAALERAWQAVALRHEALRTVIVDGPQGPRQRVLAVVPCVLERHAVQGTDEADALARAALQAEAIAQRSFDLMRGPLWRLACIKAVPAPAERYLLVVAAHPIVGDAWSASLVAADLEAAYRATRRSPQEADAAACALAPASALRFRDFALWQQAQIARGGFEAHRDYWLQRLEGVKPLQLRTDHPRRAQAWRTADRVALPAGSGGPAPQARLAVALAAVAVLLQRHSGQDDLVIGVPMPARERHGLAGQVGPHRNLVPLRLRVEPGMRCRALLEQAAQAVAEALAHADYPFAQMVEDARLQAAPGRHPVFDVLLAVYDAPLPLLQLDGTRVSRLALPMPVASLDLHVELCASAPGAAAALDGFIDYDAGLFEAASAARMAQQLRDLLDAFVAGTEGRVEELPGMEN